MIIPPVLNSIHSKILAQKPITTGIEFADAIVLSILAKRHEDKPLLNNLAAAFGKVWARSRVIDDLLRTLESIRDSTHTEKEQLALIDGALATVKQLLAKHN